MSKKILILGASGYLGARLSLLLADDGHEVTAHCRKNLPKAQDWASKMNNVIVGDLTDRETIDHITDLQFDVAIHLVSLDHHASNKTPEYVCSINVMPVWNLLNQFSEKGTLERFIYFSTMQVYGRVPAITIDEDHPPYPVNPYGLTHLMAEDICLMFNASGKVFCQSIRLSNSYGSPVFPENNCWELVINNLCKSAFEQKSITLTSDGSPQRDFIHSSDVFQALKLIINADHLRENQVYNVSSGTTMTILELALEVQSTYEARYGIKLPINLPSGLYKEELANGEIKAPTYIIDNSRLQSLGFRTRTGLKEGITELFEYLEQVKENG